MRKLLLAAVFIAGTVLGTLASGWWTSRTLSRMTVSKEVEAATIAAFEAEWLAQLRLNETKKAIEDIENCMDAQVATIAKWDETIPPDEKTRKARDRWLVPVKVYHESYPLTSEESARIRSFLDKLPGRSPNSACKSGICRLDDRRLGGTTNAVK